MARDFRASRQWERIHEYWITDDAGTDLTNFKSDRRNHKISLWDPQTNGVRYLKTLLYHLATELTPDDWIRIKRIRNRDLGNPVTVRCMEEQICLDYLQAALELGFIEREVNLDNGSVMEIGAGYGRTCHALLSNYDIREYTIVDLTKTIQLSREYLRNVLDGEQFAKLVFVPADMPGSDLEENLESAFFDLCININSLAEMTPETVDGYLDLIDRKSTHFYTKNPVGKYLDESMTGYAEGDRPVRNALENGPLRQVLDIHDSQAVTAAAAGFVDAYRPAGCWSCVADSPAIPWSYFWQAIYRNDAYRSR